MRHRRYESSSTSDSDSSSSSTSSSGSEESSSTAGESDSEDDTPSGKSRLLLVFLTGIVAVALLLAGALLYQHAQTLASSSTVASSAATGTGKTSKGASTSASGGATPTATAISTVSSDFFSSLASAYSVTPASISSLVMPPTAIPSASSALTYIDDNWSHIKGSSDFVTFVEDPLKSTGEVVLAVDYPEGSYPGGTDGGVGNMQMGVFSSGMQRAMVSYEVGFSEKFDFVEGGKLPGLFGGDANSGCTGGSNSAACFSLRLMWRTNGAGEVYGYVPQYASECDNSTIAMCHDADGISFMRGSFTFEAGVYNTVTEVAIINSDTEEANGVIALYFGETLAFQLMDVVLRINESVEFSSFIFSSFFGGSTSDYAATADCQTYYRNIVFWEGEDASSEEGATVTATIA